MRAVNAKGLDLRLRVPDWVEGLEQALRAKLSGSLKRGNVTLNLRLVRDTQSAGLRIDEAVLGDVLRALAQIDEAAQDRGVALTAPSTADILALRGIQDQKDIVEDAPPRAQPSPVS